MTPVVYDFERIVEIMRTLKPVDADPEKPYYMYGHRREIANTLTLMENNQLQYTRYPLVALRLDIVEQVQNDLLEVNLNIAILTLTKENYNAAERYANVIVPVLYPLYEKLMSAIKRSGIYFWPGLSKYPPHTKIERPYWGTQFQEGNAANIFNDPIDAIEILDLKINKRINKC
jgi:hypothetical protein